MSQGHNLNKMVKKDKLPQIGSDIKEDLAVLASKIEFKSLEKLVQIEEQNIVIQAFKINSSDPDISRKKAHLEGRLYELRKLMRTFAECLKGLEKDKEELN